MIFDYIRFCKNLENISILQHNSNKDPIYYTSLVYYASIILIVTILA